MKTEEWAWRWRWIIKEFISTVKEAKKRKINHKRNRKKSWGDDDYKRKSSMLSFYCRPWFQMKLHARRISGYVGMSEEISRSQLLGTCLRWPGIFRDDKRDRSEKKTVAWLKQSVSWILVGSVSRWEHAFCSFTSTPVGRWSLPRSPTGWRSHATQQQIGR